MPIDARFCSHCGLPIAGKKPGKLQLKLTCPGCGGSISSDEIYCGVCGTNRFTGQKPTQSSQNRVQTGSRWVEAGERVDSVLYWADKAIVGTFKALAVLVIIAIGIYILGHANFRPAAHNSSDMHEAFQTVEGSTSTHGGQSDNQRWIESLSQFKRIVHRLRAVNDTTSVSSYGNMVSDLATEFEMLETPTAPHQKGLYTLARVVTMRYQNFLRTFAEQIDWAATAERSDLDYDKQLVKESVKLALVLAVKGGDNFVQGYDYALAGNYEAITSLLEVSAADTRKATAIMEDQLRRKRAECERLNIPL